MSQATGGGTQDFKGKTAYGSMKRRTKWMVISSAGAVLLLLVGFVILVVGFRGQNKSHVIRQSTSPDGNVIAEVRELITPMHGGPDLVQVVLRPTTDAVGDVVYSRVFECGPDYSAFQVEWQSSKSLTVSYGTCDAGRYHSATDNDVFQKNATWQDVSISYRDSGHVAHAKP
jgi:hypothetical protein